MTDNNFLGNNPLLRLAIPLMFGIAISFTYETMSDDWMLLLLFSFVLMMSGMLSERVRVLFGIGAMSSMFAIGGIIEHKESESMLPRWSDTKGVYSAVFLETPRMGDKTVKALAQLQREDTDSLNGRIRGNVYLYFANCVEAENMAIGERIVFTGKVQNPKNAGNPSEFDYENYLHVKGISGTVYLPVGGWYKDGVTPLTFRMYALTLREQIVRLYSRMGFDENVASVLSALTIGDKSELTREIKETYSSSGASHILALSGLHLGVFYMLFSFLLPAWRSKRLYMFLREAVILFLLWMFAFVAGLSPSIVRAALLFTLLSIGRCLRRDISSVNTLSFAAIVILIFSPHSLFDISFQLSFAAVFAILLFHPYIREIFKCKINNTVYNYFADILSVSLAAQIGTFPFIWHAFGSFPLYFLVTNIFIIPLSFAIMALSVLLWFSTPFLFVQNGVAAIVNALVSIMNKGVGIIERLPYATLDMPYINVCETFFIATLLILFLYAAVKKRYLLLGIFSIFVMFFCMVKVWMFKKGEQNDYMLFYNSSKCPALHAICSRDTSYFISTVEETEVELDYIAHPYWKSESMNKPQWIVDDFSDENFKYKNGLVKFCNRRVKLLCDNSWQEDTIVQPVDLLYLCKGFTGRMEEVLEKYPTDRIVMDAGLHFMTRRRVTKECDLLGVFCIDIYKSGAVKFFCKDERMLPCFVADE